MNLRKKYGPLPLWAWGLLTVAVVFFGYSYFKNRSASAANPNAGQVQSNLLQPPVNGGGGSGSLTIPAMQAVEQSTDSPPFTSPSPAEVNSPSANASAVAPLDSAPVTSDSTPIAPFDPSLIYTAPGIQGPTPFDPSLIYTAPQASQPYTPFDPNLLPPAPLPAPITDTNTIPTAGKIILN